MEAERTVLRLPPFVAAHGRSHSINAPPAAARTGAVNRTAGYPCANSQSLDACRASATPPLDSSSAKRRSEGSEEASL